ncbi:MAG: dienelactone hydrolase [Parasphingorhabdus sp.]|jgi:dienelactone hydrolase
MANVINQVVEYQCNGVDHQGYAALIENGDNPRPLVIVIHEWWGVNNYIKSRVNSIAKLGYNALAIDMYGGGLVAENPTQANELMSSVLQDMPIGTARLQAGFDAGKALSGVDAGRCAAMGYCFGGAMALHMARIGMPLKIAASFHGSLGSFHKPAPGEVQASILVCHGESDEMVSMQDVANFRQEMDEAEADYQVVVYPGAQHGFTSQEADGNGAKYGIPVGYQKMADELSWQAMTELFEQKL